MIRTPQPNEVAFDPEQHRYTLRGTPLPSVTQVIKEFLPTWQADEWYLQRGTAMHYGCALLDEGRLDWSTVAPEIAGRIRAWQKFRADFGGEVVAVEQSLAHPLYQFAGTIDRIIVADGAVIVADLKSSIAPQVKMQLGAYSLLWANSEKRKVTKGVAVELKDDGAYRTFWMNQRELQLGERAFLAALTLFNFKSKEGIK